MYVIKNLSNTKADQLAYAVDYSNFTIVVSIQGHAAILRSYPDCTAGGWIYRKKGQVTMYSGYLGPIKKDKDIITDMLHQLFSF